MFYLTKIIGKYDQNSCSAVDYSILGQPPSDANQIERRVCSPAMLSYGKLPNTEIDFDLGVIYQSGHEGLQKNLPGPILQK